MERIYDELAREHGIDPSAPPPVTMEFPRPWPQLLIPAPVPAGALAASTTGVLADATRLLALALPADPAPATGGGEGGAGPGGDVAAPEPHDGVGTLEDDAPGGDR